MKVLITGPSGAGKTHLCEYFNEHGLLSVDADLVESLGEWYDHEGLRVQFPRGGADEFMDNHEFLWDREILEQLLAKHEDIFLFGSSGNVFEFTAYFDKAVYLDLPLDVMEQRLASKARRNPNGMGETEAQRKIIVEYVRDHFKPEAEQHGLILINANRSESKIMDDILQLVS